MDIAPRDTLSINYAPHYRPTTVELVHLAILKDAAEIASIEAVSDERLPEVVGGTVFVPAPLQSKRGGLALGLVGNLERLGSDKLRILHEIGANAVLRSIMKNQREFAGLIIGSAREGQNYFDRYRYGVGDQMELF